MKGAEGSAGVAGGGGLGGHPFFESNGEGWRGREKRRLWGATPKILLKGKGKRPGAGKRKEARGEALGAELLRARRPGRANRGGSYRPTAAGRWRGQLPNTGKTAPDPNTPLNANCKRNPVGPPPLRAGAQAHALCSKPTFRRQSRAPGDHTQPPGFAQRRRCSALRGN